MNERELLVDCLRRLNRTSVTYYLTGSMASNYWGIPRTTHDLDFAIFGPNATAGFKGLGLCLPSFVLRHSSFEIRFSG